MSDVNSEELRQYTIEADDGAEVPLSRLSNPPGRPVVLIPGMCDNRRIFWTADGKGLANHLRTRGHDVWIVERRGSQGRKVPSGVRRGWNEAVRHDLPAAQGFISAHTAATAVWVGHSYGGVIISRGLSERTLDQQRIAGVVLIGSAIDVPLMRVRALRALARARFWRDPLPTHILGFGPEDEYRDQLEDMFTWSDAERVTGHTAARLAAVTTPLLAMPGHYDMLSPPKACDRLAAGYGSTDKQRIQISRRNGFASDLGHDTLLMNTRRPRADVFHTVATWIENQTADNFS